MDHKNGKRLLITALSASVLLVVAGIIFLVLALSLGWDIAGGLSSPTAFLIYGILAVLILAIVGTIVRYYTHWRYK